MSERGVDLVDGVVPAPQDSVTPRAPWVLLVSVLTMVVGVFGGWYPVVLTGALISGVTMGLSPLWTSSQRRWSWGAAAMVLAWVPVALVTTDQLNQAVEAVEQQQSPGLASILLSLLPAVLLYGGIGIMVWLTARGLRRPR